MQTSLRVQRSQFNEIYKFKSIYAATNEDEHD